MNKPADPSSDNPLAQWAALVSRRANALNKSAGELAKLLGVEAVEVNNWLSGRVLPNKNMHTALMGALQLPHTVEDIQPLQLKGMAVTLAIARAQIEALYSQAADQQIAPPSPRLAAAPRSPSALPASPTLRVSQGNPTLRISQGKQTQRGEFRDHEIIKPLRLHSGGAPYEDLAEERLRQYLNKTRNAHEYLRCYRILKGVSQTAIKNLIFGYDQTERGVIRPSPAMLEKIREQVFNNATGTEDKAAYNHFVDRVIRNRQLIVNHLIASGNDRIAMTEMAQMPAVYWQEALARYLRPQAWEARKNKPDWNVHKIERRGEYLRAIRGALGLSEEQLGVELKCSGFSISLMEYDESIISNIRDRAIAYFKKEFPKLGLGEFDESKIPPAPQQPGWVERSIDKPKNPGQQER